MDRAAYYPIAADQDRDFILEIDAEDDLAQPFDFTGYTGKMEIRGARSKASPLVATATVTLSVGLIKIEIAKASMQMEPQEGWYDLAMTDPDGDTINWLAGPFTIQGVATDA